MLKWAHNSALRPNSQPIQHSLWSEEHGSGRRVEQLPKDSCPGRRRSLGSLLAKEPITKKGQIGPHVRSRVTRKTSLGTESKAPLAVHDDALDRNMKTKSLTRTDGLGRDESFLKESPLKRLIYKRSAWERCTG